MRVSNKNLMGVTTADIDLSSVQNMVSCIKLGNRKDFILMIVCSILIVLFKCKNNFNSKQNVHIFVTKL